MITRESPGPVYGPCDSGDLLSLQTHVLSLDQIQSTGSTNEYTEGPEVVPQPGIERVSSQSLQRKTEPAPDPSSEDERQPLFHCGSELPCPRGTDSPPCSSTELKAASAAKAGLSDAGNDQGLWVNPPAKTTVRAQPRPSDLKPEEVKTSPGTGLGSRHSHLCTSCRRCRCEECAQPRALPSCWLCGRRCMCSAEDLVDYGTCICCVKGLFYHCSGDDDDEDVYTDDPCVCGQPGCCPHWAVMAVVSLFLPCLWCYYPVTGCLKLCQYCHDRASRPGCRCKSGNVAHGKGTSTPA